MIDLTTISDEELCTLHKETVDEIAALNNKQMATKVLINSLYGACG